MTTNNVSNRILWPTDLNKISLLYILTHFQFTNVELSEEKISSFAQNFKVPESPSTVVTYTGDVPSKAMSGSNTRAICRTYVPSPGGAKSYSTWGMRYCKNCWTETRLLLGPPIQKCGLHWTLEMPKTHRVLLELTLLFQISISQFSPLNRYIFVM